MTHLNSLCSFKVSSDRGLPFEGPQVVQEPQAKNHNVTANR